ncbi:MAG TPA: 3'-5' exonuclease, partial [Oscillospiraceae bacterium]|nr:3'-5' exonuclease [Oscillospiraceae bacterium]
GRAADSDEVPPSVTEEDLRFLDNYVNSPSEQDRARAEALCVLDPAPPWSILAITFTNKAAGELKNRLEKLLGGAAPDVWAATFHSACVRILRREIDRLGFPRSFTIYDTDDSARVLKDILKSLGLDEKVYAPKMLLGHFGRYKDAMASPEDALREAKERGDLRRGRIAELYAAYQKRLRKAGAVDFDDIIYLTVRLLSDDEEVRRHYQRRFRYVLVDEYQDTNHMQYLLARLLSGGRENLCVVGDDDQSIYRFRGATIENILGFQEEYKNCRVIRLEQNYRSTKTILEAANGVIQNNARRCGKELWCDADAGEKVLLYTAASETDEARYVAGEILSGFAAGQNWRENAILYRINAQSYQFERALAGNNIPYRVFGGTRFFDRAEVKDMLSYLCVVANPADDLRLLRIVNTPPRGIGQKTLDAAADVAAREGRTLFEILSQAGRYETLRKAAPRLEQFAALVEGLRKKAEELPLPEFYDEVVEKSGYLIMLEAKNNDESRARAENVQELRTSISDYMEGNESPSLADYLANVALFSDLDNHDETGNYVVLMTIHSAKGLEFPRVFVAGMEEGIFPGLRAIGEPDEMEEERRLCYVAFTRAKQRLVLTCARMRMLFGRTSSNRPSRFTDEIPPACLERASFADGISIAPPHSFPASESYGDRRTETIARRAAPVGTRGSGAARGAPKKIPSPARAAAPLPDFRKGDMVTHTAFGRGMVTAVQPMGGDALLEIAFDGVGTKRLMAKSAGAYMKKG